MMPSLKVQWPWKITSMGQGFFWAFFYCISRDISLEQCLAHGTSSIEFVEWIYLCQFLNNAGNFTLYVGSDSDCHGKFFKDTFANLDPSIGLAT